MLQTEFAFTLPKGYVDEAGEVHREGMMRLATAADEIMPVKDPRVQSNPEYLSVLILSRVVTRLGTLPSMRPTVIEGLFTADLAYLQDMYQRINQGDDPTENVTCPACGKVFTPPPVAAGMDGASRSATSLQITPNIVRALPHQEIQFEASISGAAYHYVIWAVREEGGGTIDQHGIYTAPSQEGVYEVSATGRYDARLSCSAYVVVKNA